MYRTSGTNDVSAMPWSTGKAVNGVGRCWAVEFKRTARDCTGPKIEVLCAGALRCQAIAFAYGLTETLTVIEPESGIVSLSVAVTVMVWLPELHDEVSRE